MIDKTRDHGGNIGAAMAQFGGQPSAWIDLSTGINRIAYPIPALPPKAWHSLPDAAEMAAALAAAQEHYGSSAPAMICAGAQAAIQMIPQLRPIGQAAVLSPSYNEHAACLRAQGWRVLDAPDLAAMRGADLAVVVNPNNPDGRVFSPDDLLALLPEVGLLIVDESFGDVAPQASLLPYAGQEKLLILRSFGKFWGLAGARFGLVFGPQADIDHLRALAGPWPVSGPALHIARMAYADRAWADASRARLAQDAAKMDDLARAAGWGVLGGCDLFRLYQTPNAAAAQARLARAHIWSRIFPYSTTWLRLGPAGAAQEWDRLAAALG